MIQERKLLEMSHEFIDSVHSGEWGSSTDRDELVIAIEATLAQPAQESVACKHEWFRTGAMEQTESRCIKCGAWNTTTPPKRPWVGLTDEERSQLVTLHHGWSEYAQAIEAKLKEKNS
jgi:hypothetical protein